MKLRHFISFFYWFLCSCAFGQPASQAPVSIEAGLNGSNKDLNNNGVKIRTSGAHCEVPKWFSDDKFDRMSNCIESIVITVRSKEYFFPRDSYWLFGQPSNVRLTSRAEGVALEISGGDASNSYNVMFWFNKQGVLKRRLVYSPSFRTEAWEDTRYSYNMSNR
jgi:hypothetical protein